MAKLIDCPVCHGRGTVSTSWEEKIKKGMGDSKPCKNCGGSGKKQVK